MKSIKKNIHETIDLIQSVIYLFWIFGLFFAAYAKNVVLFIVVCSIPIVLSIAYYFSRDKHNPEE